MKKMRLLTFFSFTFPAFCGIVSTTGQLLIISHPASVQVNDAASESDTTGFLFSERTATLLTSLSADIVNPGTYSSNAGMPLGSIASGTPVASYYIHVDPVGSDVANNRNYDGSVTFDVPIIGIIVLDAEFAASNSILGAPGTLYSSSAQGLELASPRDSVTFSADRRTLSFSFGTNTAADDIRIITAVPEPGSWALVVTGLGLLIVRTIRRRTA